MDLDASLLNSKKGSQSIPTPYAFAVLPPSWTVAFHVVCFSTEAVGLVWSGLDIIQRAKKGEDNPFPFGSMYVFLTVWNLTINAIFFLFSSAVSIGICLELRDAAESRDWADKSAIDGNSGTDQAQARSLSDGTQSIGFRQPSGFDMLGGLTSDYEDQTGVLGSEIGGYASNDTFGGSATGTGLSSDDVFGYGAGATAVAPSPYRRSSSAAAGSRNLGGSRPSTTVTASSYNGWAPNDGLGRSGRFLSGLTRGAIVVRDRLFGLAVTVGVMVGIGYWGVLFPNPAYTDKFIHHPNEAGKSSIMHGAMALFIVAELLLVRHRWAAQWWQGMAGTMAFAAAYVGWNVLTFEENGVWPYPSVQKLLWHSPGVAAAGYAGIVVLVGTFHLQLRWLSLWHWSALDAGTCAAVQCCCHGRRHVPPACHREPCCCCCPGNKVGVTCFPNEDPFSDGVPPSRVTAGRESDRRRSSGGRGGGGSSGGDIFGYAGAGASGVGVTSRMEHAGNGFGENDSLGQSASAFGGFTEAGSGKDAMGFGEGNGGTGRGGFAHYNGRAAEQESRARAREQKGIRVGEVGAEADHNFGFGGGAHQHQEDASGVRAGDVLAQDAFGVGGTLGALGSSSAASGEGGMGGLFDQDVPGGGAAARAFLKTQQASDRPPVAGGKAAGAMRTGAGAGADEGVGVGVRGLPEESLGTAGGRVTDVAAGGRRFVRRAVEDDDDDSSSSSDDGDEQEQPATSLRNRTTRSTVPRSESPLPASQAVAQASEHRVDSGTANASNDDPFGGGAADDPFGGGGGVSSDAFGGGDSFGAAGAVEGDAYDAAAGGGIGGGLF